MMPLDLMNIKNTLSAESKRYSYKIPAFIGIDRRLDGQISSEGVSFDAYNVDMSDGALRRCSGFSKVKKFNRWVGGYGHLPQCQSIRKMLYLRDNYGDTVLYPVCSDGLYREELGFGEIAYEKVSDASDTEVLLDYPGTDEEGNRVKYVLRSGERGLDVSCDGKAWVLWDHGFNSAVIFAERLFGVGAPKYPNRIFFSAQFMPYEFTADIDKGGYIDVDPSYGKARDIVVMGNCIYILWEYGITRLKAYGYQSEFVLTQCYRCSSRILRGAKVCGTNIVFVSDDGIYSFNGDTVKRIGEQVFSAIELGDADGVISEFFDDRYYLAVHSSAHDGEGNNAVFRYDLRNGKWSIYTLDVICMARINTGNKEEMIFVLGDGYTYCFDGSDSFGEKAIESGWSSVMSSLGKPDALKDVKAVYVSAAGDGRLKVTLTSERGSVSKSFGVRGKRRVYRIPIRLRGRLLRLTFENCDGCDFVIAEPTVIFSLEQGK